MGYIHTYIQTQHIEYGSNISHMTLIYKLQIIITTAWTVNTLPVVCFQWYCLRHLLLTCYLLGNIRLCPHSHFPLQPPGVSADERRSIQDTVDRTHSYGLVSMQFLMEGLNWYSFSQNNAAIGSVSSIIIIKIINISGTWGTSLGE